MKGALNEKRTIKPGKVFTESKKYLHIRRKFKHNNNDFKKGLAQSAESNRPGKIHIKL